MTGTQTTEDHADLVVMFPVTPDAKTFSPYDGKGTLLKNCGSPKCREPGRLELHGRLWYHPERSASREARDHEGTGQYGSYGLFRGGRAAGYVLAKKTPGEK